MTKKIDQGPIIKQFKVRIKRDDNLLKLMGKLKVCWSRTYKRV